MEQSMRVFALRGILLIVLTALVLGGCQAQTIVTDTPIPAASSPAPTAVAAARPTPELGAQFARMGEPAIDFALDSLDETPVFLSDFKGKTVIVTFWATWCPPCQEEIPGLVTLYPDLQARNAELLSVNVLEAPDKVRAYVQDMGINYPVLLDTRGLVAMTYGVRGIPASLFIDKQGVLRHIQVGALSREVIDYYLAEMER